MFVQTRASEWRLTGQWTEGFNWPSLANHQLLGVSKTRQSRRSPMMPRLKVSGFDIDSADEQDRSELQLNERSIFTFLAVPPGTALHLVWGCWVYWASSSEHNTQVILTCRSKTYESKSGYRISYNSFGRYGAEHRVGWQNLALSERLDSTDDPKWSSLLLSSVGRLWAESNRPQYHDPLSAKSGWLRHQTVQGMLKGFIDLVFGIKVNTMYSTGNRTI